MPKLEAEDSFDISEDHNIGLFRFLVSVFVN